MKTRKKTMYMNGKIFTANDALMEAEAMLVVGGRIEWIGKNSEMPEGEYDYVDLEDKRVLPGFIDAHIHPILLADYSKKISSLPPTVNSIEDLISEIKKVRVEQGQGVWIEGWGFDEGKLKEKRTPNRYDLDRGCDDSPIVIIRTCAHICCVNSKALELAGIDSSTPDPFGGKIDRDVRGEPTGILRETAKDLITAYLPKKDFETTIEDLKELGDLLLSQGITAVTDMGVFDNSDTYAYYREAAKMGFKQKVRLYYMWNNHGDEEEFYIPAERFNRSQNIQVAGVKLIADGSVSGKTAWMNLPYLNEPLNYGLSVCSDHELESAIDFCKRNCCQLSVHAMGGKAIDRIINRVSLEKKWTECDIPHLRVEHITEPSEIAIAKAVEYGYGFAIQPIFLYCEIESYLKNIGEDRTKNAYPVKDMSDRNALLCFSTDAPATSWAMPSDPFPCLKSAITRVAYDGTDCGQHQKIDIRTAIKMYSNNAAKVAGFKEMGQLRKGFHADFIVLNDDILNIDSFDIDTVYVEQTYIDGEIVFERR